MKKYDLIIALSNVVRPVFDVASFEAEYLTKAFEAAAGDSVAFNKALSAKAEATAEALAKWTAENAEKVAEAEATATPFIILNKVVTAKAAADDAIAKAAAKVTKAKTAEAKAKAEADLSDCRKKHAEALALAEALAEALAFVSDPTAKAKAEALAKAAEVAAADNAKGKFSMYWNCQNTDGTRKSVCAGVYSLPHALGSAEAAANCLLSYSVFLEAEYRKAKTAEALANCLQGLEDRASKYIEKGGFLETLEEKFASIISSLAAKAEAKAAALADEAKTKWNKIAEAEAIVKATAEAAAEVEAKTAKGRKLSAKAAKALRALEAAKTSWDVFKHDHPSEAAAAEDPAIENAA